MSDKPTASSPRIHSVDAVRAVALFGILMAHARNFFNVHQDFVPDGMMDGILGYLYVNLFVERFFLIFSFLFGLSFFLQMDRAMAKGLDFRGRFCWRLTLLAGFALFHSWFYLGDILLTFAITGFIPVLLWRCPTKVLVGLCGICLLQPLALYHNIIGTPDALRQWYDGIRETYQLTWAPPAQTATFTEMGIWNITTGIWHSLLFVIYSYRIWALVGMFLLGMIAGRLRVFEGKMSCNWLMVYAGGAWLLVKILGGCMDDVKYWGIIEPSLFVLWFVPLLAQLLNRPGAQWIAAPLGKLGRCTLTCYITQNIIMVWLLCGYGAGLSCTFSVTGILAAAFVLYLLQLIACNIWLRFFRYGPFEGLWRYLTRLGMKKPTPKEVK